MNDLRAAPPIRIGIDYRPVTATPCSGIARQVLAMERALAGRPGVQVIRFTAGPFEHPHRLDAQCPPWESPLNGLHRPRERLKFEAGFLPSAIREQEPDFYIATVNAGLPLRRPHCRTRFILLLHDVFQLTMDSFHATRLRKWIYRRIDHYSIRHSVAMADAIWTPSQFTATGVGRLFPRHRSRIAVLPNAVPVPEQVSDIERADGVPDRYWLVVGTREPRKNIPWFISQWSAARLVNVVIPALVVVGHAGDLPESLRSLPGLVFASDIDDAMLRALYRHAERLWQPSLAEGFGLPIIEALAEGTPVAVATGSALDEVAPPHAPRFDPCGGDELQALMKHLAADPMSTPTLNRQWALRYSMPIYSERLWKLLRELMVSRSAA